MTKSQAGMWGRGRSQEQRDFLAFRGRELAFNDYLRELRRHDTHPWRRWYAAKNLLFVFGDFLDAVIRPEAEVVYNLGEPPMGGGGPGPDVLQRARQKTNDVTR